MATFRRTKLNWERPSLNPMGSTRKQAVDPVNYRPRSPWEQDSNEVVDDFDQQLNALDKTVEAPWDEGSYELELKDRQRQEAKQYKYQSLFEVPPLSEHKQKQLASYAYNPPYRCEFNQVDEKAKPAKKLDSERKNPKTRAPWSYGELPAEPVHRKIADKPSTTLWDVPKGDQSAANTPLESSGDPVLDNLRAELKSHGAIGISGLARKFRIMDDDGSGTLDFSEFRKGIKECGLTTLSEKAMKHLFLYFGKFSVFFFVLSLCSLFSSISSSFLTDRDDSGNISYDEFLVGIRGVMNERRKSLVLMAFKILDSDNSGQIDINDIKGIYNAKFHPDVIAEKKTEDEVLADFLSTFDRPTRGAAAMSKKDKQKQPKQVINSKTGKPVGDGIITKEEFLEYYSNISASVDNDDYFELMIRNAWHISGGKGNYENTTNKRILVTDVHGNQTIQELKDDTRLKKDDANAMLENLKKQGIENIAYLNTTDKLSMKNTIQNPNIRTKYATADENKNGISSPMPLNAFSLTNNMSPPKNSNYDANGKPMPLNAFRGRTSDYSSTANNRTGPVGNRPSTSSLSNQGGMDNGTGNSRPVSARRVSLRKTLIY
jgi:Ca2+-binding EF-hand superfamily protein